jgi:hypothetical protein
MTVRIYAGNVFLEEVNFDSENEAEQFASEMQDRGYKVRFLEEA